MIGCSVSAARRCHPSFAKRIEINLAKLRQGHRVLRIAGRQIRLGRERSSRAPAQAHELDVRMCLDLRIHAFRASAVARIPIKCNGTTIGQC
jgi:hypothetical protein